MKVYALAEIKRALQKIDVLPLIKEGLIAYSSGLTVVPPVGELLFDDPPGAVSYTHLTLPTICSV